MNSIKLFSNAIHVFNDWISLFVFLTMTLLKSPNCYGQQTPYLSHYFRKAYILNPASAGDNEANAFLIYRQQWVGIPGAPETQALGINGTIPEKNFGLGVNITNDATDIISRFSGVVSSSYRATLGDSHDLSFGLSAGFLRYQLNFDKIRADLTDPEILRNVQNATRLEGNAGFSYHFRALKIGLISEQLFNRTFTFSNSIDTRDVKFALVRHYAVSAEYQVKLGGNFSLRPLLLIRSAQGLRSRFDVNATLNFRDVAWLNIQHRVKIASAFALGAAITERFSVSYSYELPGSGIGSVTSGSHEVMLGMNFQQAQKRPANSSRSVYDRKHRLNKETESNNEQVDELRQKNELLSQELLEQKELLERQNNELEALRKTIGNVAKEIEVMIDNVGVDLDAEKIFDNDFEYLVVIGAMKKISEARMFQKMVLKETGIRTYVMQNHHQSWFFVYTDIVQSNKEAREKIELLEEKNILRVIIGNPWVYKLPKKR